MEPLLIQANAKINLTLKILGKRKDGFHLIESVFQSIDLADFLLIEKAKRNELIGAKICPDKQNIIYQARRSLEKFCAKRLPCRISLQKTIPIASGLGGGSADAAAVLWGLNELYGLSLRRQQLAKIGAKIGADVPFFFYGGTCKITGAGEKITTVKKNLPEFFVVFRPHKRVETKKMYELHDKTGRNFLTLAKEICPEIRNLQDYFSRFKLKLKMSGSGPTVFCGVRNYRLAGRVAENYSNFNGDIFICRPQNRAIKVIK